MKKNYLVLVSIVLLIASCGTPKKTVQKEQIPPPPLPEGIQFTGVKNYKSFAFINYPYGSGFTPNQDVDVDNVNDAGVFVPGLKFEGTHVAVWSKLGGVDGDLDVQFKGLKKKMLYSYIRENTTVDFEKIKIGNRDVALIRIVTPISGGGINYTYGYLIAHDEHTASCFVLLDALIWKADEEKVQAYEAIVDKAFVYMIKTVEFR